MKRALLVVVLLVSSFFGGAQRQAFGAGLRGDGNELFENCSLALSNKDKTSAEIAKANFCIGFVAGFVRSIIIYETADTNSGRQNSICLPQAPLGQYVRVAHKYLQDHPEKLHHDEGALVFEALQEAFPCPKK
jgi:hypothetical protein